MMIRLRHLHLLWKQQRGPSMMTSSSLSSSSLSSSFTFSTSSSSSPSHTYDFTSTECNIPTQIQQQIGKNLYLQKNHPLCIVQQQIAHYFNHILLLPSSSSSSNAIRTQFEQEQKLSNHKMNNILHEIYEKEHSPHEVSSSSSSSYFTVHDNISPIVSTKECFDELLIDTFHPSRHKTDTYYINDKTVLRPHTSAHQIPLIRQSILNNKSNDENTTGSSNNSSENENDTKDNNNTTNNTTTSTYSKTAVQFLCVGDVYRRDEIDKSHYPIFHQMEGVKLFHIPKIRNYTDQQYNMVEKYIQFHLKQTLEGMIRFLFAQKNVTDIPMRWRDDTFPFTDPSYELDIYYNDEWMEILGCGMIRYELLESVNYYYNNPEDENIDTFDIRNTVMNEKHVSKNILDYKTHKGWAFGIGLERLAMILFQIPDIRLFWSDDVRFHEQFQTGDIRTIPDFQPYSKYPPCIKDMSFWISNFPNYHVNDTYEIIRNIGGDLIERVELIDTYTRVNPKNIDLTKVSHCYRITYRSMDRSLTNAEIDEIQEEIRRQVVQQLKVELR